MELSPEMIGPASKSMMSLMRFASGVLVEILITGAMGLINWHALPPGGLAPRAADGHPS